MKNYNFNFKRPSYRVTKTTEWSSSFEGLYIQMLFKCGYTKENPLVFDKPLTVTEYLDLPGFFQSGLSKVTSVWVEKPERFNGKAVIGFSSMGKSDNIFINSFDKDCEERSWFSDLEDIKEAIHNAAWRIKDHLDYEIVKLLPVSGARVTFKEKQTCSFLNAKLERETVELRAVWLEDIEDFRPVVKYVSDGEVFIDYPRDLYIPDLEAVRMALKSKNAQVKVRMPR